MISGTSCPIIPTIVELISNASGTYSVPFWDGRREVTGTLDTVRKIRAVLKTRCSTGNDTEAYNLILAIYDLIAVETPPDIIELEPYPDAIRQILTVFPLDIDDLLIDYESEE